MRVHLAHPVVQPDIALVVGRAAWWVPAQARRKQRKSSFAESFKDFLQNVSFHCYAKLVEPGRRFQERFFWLLFHTAALSIMLIFLWNVRINDEGRQLATTILDPIYPAEKVPFPVVSICSINRISNASATRYAIELNAKDPLRRGVNYFYMQIHQLSYNYFENSAGLDDNERALDFQQFLDMFDTDDTELFYNTRSRMKMLTPRCGDILLNCRLGGREIDCSTEFVVSLTARGFCCSFNHYGKYAMERDFEMSFYGNEMGLIVLLNATTSDYYYKQLSLNGFVVIINSPSDYPDVMSGTVRESFVSNGVESIVALTPKILQTVDEARFWRPTARQCLFADERPGMFGHSYSFNRCITHCRIRSILVLCQCIMFTAPLHLVADATDTVFCTLQHRQCIQRYSFKWANVIMERADVEGLAREMEDALYCPDCLPSCNETRYKFSLMELPLNAWNTRFFPKDLIANNSELAVLRVYFAAPTYQYLLQILKSSWFEIFSTVGSICGVMTGISLVGICEVLFFLMRQLYAAYKNEIRSDRNRNRNRTIKTKETLIILP